MKAAFRSLEHLRIYFLICMLFIVTGTVFSVLFDKASLHLKINQFHNSFWDAAFPYITHAGDGLTAICCVLLIVFLAKKQFRYQYLLLGGLTLLLSGLAAQLLKHLVYPEVQRPIKFIGQEYLYLIPDVNVHAHNSFPSGHATTTFALLCFLLFVSRWRHWSVQILFACAAIFISFSRIYLSQHFLEDVVAGAVIGILSYLIAHLFTALMPFKQAITRR